MGLACRSCRSNSPCGGRRSRKNHISLQAFLTHGSHAPSINWRCVYFMGLLGQNLREPTGLNRCLGSPVNVAQRSHSFSSGLLTAQCDFRQRNFNALTEPKQIVWLNMWNRGKHVACAVSGWLWWRLPCNGCNTKKNKKPHLAYPKSTEATMSSFKLLVYDFVPQAFLYGVLKYGVPSAGTIQPSIASARLAWIESDKWVTQIEILPNISLRQ